jgi:hypothetical protein
MTIRVYKVAEVIEGTIFSCSHELRYSHLVEVLMSFAAVGTTTWKAELTIGQGVGKRTVEVDVPSLPGASDLTEEPTFLQPTADRPKGVFYKNRFFLAERPVGETERAEVVLRVKKAVYDEEAELASLRAAVANMEAAIEYQRIGPRRDPIPDDVKLLVWARDGGSCVRCGSTQELHFDHVIPVASGGGNSADNIQILCGPCNRRKSDKIAMP